jgi:predicted Zn-dependent peptidase
MKVEETKLKNGAKIIGVKMPGTDSVLISFGFRTGSRTETDDIAGISHFLEHMVFKGSVKRSSTEEISKAADSIGAQYNAYTGKEYTVYYIKTSPDNFGLALDIVGDMVTRPLLLEKELKKEKGTIIQEAKMYEDNPNLSIFGHMESVLYGKTPLGREIVGLIKSIKSTNSKKMRRYFEKYYTGLNNRVVVVGNLPKDYVSSIKPYALRLKQGKKTVWKRSPLNKTNLGLTIKSIEQAHLGLTIPAYDLFNEKRYVMQVIANILGGYMSARLFTEIREKRGWAYRVWAYSEEASDTGYLGIFGGVKKDKALESLAIMKKEVLNLAKTVTNEEVYRAVENLKGSSVLKYEVPEELANLVIMQSLLKDKIELPQSSIAKLSKITKKEVIDIANELFVNDKLHLAVIGPFKDKKKFVKMMNHK